MLRLIHMERNQQCLHTPSRHRPIPAKGCSVDSGDDDSQIPAIPLPNPGEGGPVYSGDDDNAQIPVIPLPNPGEGGPVYPRCGFIQPVQPIQPLPTVTYAAVRFLNAAYGYPAFRVYVGNRRAAKTVLNFASLSAYVRLAAGYQTVTVTGTGRLHLHPEDHSILKRAADSPSPSSTAPAVWMSPAYHG